MSKSWRDTSTTFYGYQNKVTNEQANYLDSIESNRLTISNSVSGSGKTTLAVAHAHFHKKKLLYLFAPIEEGQMGFRPGGQQTKESAYYGPLQDALLEINQDPSKVIKINNENEEDISLNWKSMAKSKKEDTTWVEAKSHIFLRGTNIGKLHEVTDKRTCVIIDEAQNWTRTELRKTLTRIHDKATVVVIGHVGQIDLPNPNQSGFEGLINHFKDKHYVELCPLTVNFRGELSKDADEL